MGVTVTEKNHWKDRIKRRIDKRIEAIYAEDPNLKERIERDARSQALKSLKLTELEDRLQQIEKSQEELEREEKRVYQTQLAVVRGLPTETASDINIHRSYHGYDRPHEVDKAIERRQAVHADELLAQDQHGQQILKLRQEKENLLDTVWLATSPSQVRELWQKVTQLLGDQPTQLEKDALAIEPTSDD